MSHTTLRYFALQGVFENVFLNLHIRNVRSNILFEKFEYSYLQEE